MVILPSNLNREKSNTKYCKTMFWLMIKLWKGLWDQLLLQLLIITSCKTPQNQPTEGSICNKQNLGNRVSDSIVTLLLSVLELQNVWASLVAWMVKCLPTIRETWFNPWVGKITWRRKWQPASVFMPGKSNGLRSLVGYSPWGCKESDMTEWLLFTSLHSFMIPVP